MNQRTGQFGHIWCLPLSPSLSIFLSILHPYSGQLDSSLAPNGRKQATLLGHRLASECVTHVYSSDLIRAKEVRKLASQLALILITGDQWCWWQLLVVQTADIALMEVKPLPHIVEDVRLRERVC